jgi:hypothetical protein
MKMMKVIKRIILLKSLSNLRNYKFYSIMKIIIMEVFTALIGQDHKDLLPQDQTIDQSKF